MNLRYIICLFSLLMMGEMAIADNDLSTIRLKKAWKLEQVYLDSVPSPIDSMYAKYRLALTDDDISFVNDGKNVFQFKWNHTGNQLLFLVANKIEPVLIYNIVFIDDTHLVVTIDTTKYNLAIKLVEYRLIPDPDFILPVINK